ncbi:ABC transporter [Sphaerisporangium siamense]|uniref:NitT/TauT family transport system ATP-binding protein n=1 Tax=Sphaerisporangium siamense TaxID=795645 RepID=A0A7W7DAV8_9ACTN|nr:ABC transporter ATP-binding protein [Sphaerisporangium siamense]MBB4703468.1 NitT/TauT family transport system ATP-binding protein [Sphaerisporangium siamense]GII87538.1 ABC transporter [Sphaerisporangium siamense]
MLEVAGLSKSYGEGDGAVRAIDDLTFTVNPHEFVCIVGPSGCGKTTLLKCLSGLMPPTGGRAVLDGTVIDDPPETLALVFQEYTRSLLPWMTVLDNVVLPLRAKGMGKAERRRLALESLEAVGLAEFTHVYPWQLSGGMQQRVAIARALAYRPKVLLMDEPFASVDAQTRAELEDLMLQVRDTFDVTVVLVTHDIDEAVYLADRVVVLSKRPTRVREIVEVGLPRARDQVTTKEDPRFARLRGHVARLIVGAPGDAAAAGDLTSAPAEVA